MRLSAVDRAFRSVVFRAETDPRARFVLNAFINAFFHAVAFERKRGGHRLLDYAREGAVRFGRWRAPILKEKLGLDVNDMADLARLQDWEDRVFGVTGHWTERGKTHATKCETACPFAKAASGAPELCSDVIHAMETATFRELNPGYRLLPLERLLSKGESRCEFRHEIEGRPPG
jgi:hypothetical protein